MFYIEWLEVASELESFWYKQTGIRVEILRYAFNIMWDGTLVVHTKSFKFLFFSLLKLHKAYVQRMVARRVYDVLTFTKCTGETLCFRIT